MHQGLHVDYGDNDDNNIILNLLYTHLNIRLDVFSNARYYQFVLFSVKFLIRFYICIRQKFTKFYYFFRARILFF